ncbi:hypothetical protein L21SP5_01217 [Salinivirga cyanobacteriivorans]|uniref:Uncharacterized protein n=1 Tax=Salinivirga cyanobacteriivorans TaxID=1307839 RepID=A0A0S2HXY7_9BACT|nr:hypothetical protein [Salinivirga cyanobacteriivorans]ALO14872.1 hypothetical protein L21SP5_01217 [Salinivirga cyanobacteriivorans]
MNIEEYINKNRGQLDNKVADKARIWAGIADIQARKKTRRIKITQWVAASLVILLVTGILLRHEMVMQQHVDNLSQINTELAKKEQHYQQQINQKWNQFQQIPAHSSPLESMLIDELKELDTLYKQGLKDIKKNPDNDRAVMILLETYEKRLRILEKLIYERHKQIRYEKRNENIEL